MTTIEQKLISSLQEFFGSHFINETNGDGILDDLTALLIARRSFGVHGDNPLAKLNRVLDEIKENNRSQS